MSWRGLRYKGTEVLRSTEWNAAVDALNDLYGMFTSGQSDITVDELNARTAHFKERPDVGGRVVLLDEDPVHIASFYDIAKRQITEAVDASQLYNIWRRAVDDYGRVGVRIYEPVDTEGRVVIAAPAELLSELSPVSATSSVTASSNTSGLTVQLNKGGRPYVNVYYALGGPGTVYVEVSLNGSAWHMLDTITTSLPGDGVKIYQGVAYPFIRVRTTLTGADVAFEIVASR
jgi:hypothetical protein